MNRINMTVTVAVTASPVLFFLVAYIMMHASRRVFALDDERYSKSPHFMGGEKLDEG